MKISFDALITNIDDKYIYFIATDQEYLKNALQTSRSEVRMKVRRIEYWVETVGKHIQIEAYVKHYKRGGQICTGLIEA